MHPPLTFRALGWSAGQVDLLLIHQIIYYAGKICHFSTTTVKVHGKKSIAKQETKEECRQLRNSIREQILY